MKPKMGQCSLCGEWTDVAEPCCGWAVRYEGHLLWPEDEEEDEDVAEGIHTKLDMSKASSSLRDAK